MFLWQVNTPGKLWVLLAHRCDWNNYNPTQWHVLVFSQNRMSFKEAPTIRPMPIDHEGNDGDDDNHPPGPPHQPDQDMPQAPQPPRPDPPATPDVPMPQATPVAQQTPVIQGVRPDAPVLLPRQQQPQSANQPISSTSRLNRLGGDVSKPPNRPTVVVPPPKQKQPSLPPVPEDDDDEMQEAGTPSKKHKKNKDSPREAKPSVPASSSNDPPTLPISSLGPSSSPGIPPSPAQQDDPGKEEESSEELQEDQEEPESSDSQQTRFYTDEESDLVLDEALWTQFTHDQKVCSNTGSFTVPRDIQDRPISLHTVHSAEAHNNFTFYAHTHDNTTSTTLSQCAVASPITTEQSSHCIQRDRSHSRLPRHNS